MANPLIEKKSIITEKKWERVKEPTTHDLFLFWGTNPTYTLQTEHLPFNPIWCDIKQDPKPPINLESIGKDFYEPINKERKCPICKNPLFYDMFIARNTHEIKDIQSYLNEKESLTELWEDKRVAIPCCSCFTRLESESK